MVLLAMMPWACSLASLASRGFRLTRYCAKAPGQTTSSMTTSKADDLEEFHCPEIEWDWDDGGKSVQESDCQPYTPGTKIERRFSNDHNYGKAGIYNVTATLRRTNRTFAQATVRVTVRAGLGDPTIERDN